MIAALFYNPITLGWNMEMWLVLPLCAAVGLVYKAVRVEHISELPWEYLKLLIYMACGLFTLCT